MSAPEIELTARQRAAVVGSGPNGLTAAAFLARAGWHVDVYERHSRPGGAAGSNGTLGPGSVVDLGAAAHPFGVASPAFRALDLESHGLTWLHSKYPLAHPLEGSPAAILHRDLEATAAELGRDGEAWQRIHRPVVDHIDEHLANVLGPLLRWPKHPLRLAQFGVRALLSARGTSRLAFRDEAARALFMGSAAHAISPLGQPFTSAFGVLFGALGMTRGWPVAKGGSGAIIDALLDVVTAAGGRVHLNQEVTDLRLIPAADATLLNLTPAQVLRLRGSEQLAKRSRRRLAGWKYGMAAFKVDFLLGRPIPWADPRVGEATTVHVVGTAAELHEAETLASRGVLPDRPFVMVGQQRAADPSRASGPAAGKTVVWSYAHVPRGYVERYPGEVGDLIERQIERFAPGFRDTIDRRQDSSPADLESWNRNLVGGDIAGGAMTGTQLLLRPGFTLDPYRLGGRTYLCSSSTPPGAGVHGMPGYWAARAAMRDVPSTTGDPSTQLRDRHRNPMAEPVEATPNAKEIS